MPIKTALSKTKHTSLQQPRKRSISLLREKQTKTILREPFPPRRPAHMKSLRSRSAGEAVHPPRGAQGSTAQQHASCRPAAPIPGTDPEVRRPVTSSAWDYRMLETTQMSYRWTQDVHWGEAGGGEGEPLCMEASARRTRNESSNMQMRVHKEQRGPCAETNQKLTRHFCQVP